MPTLLPVVSEYFDGERAEAIALAACCGLLLVAAVALLLTRDRFAVGLAGTLALAGLVGAGTALPLLRRDTAHRATLSAELASPRAREALAAEQARMRGVISRYAWYRAGYLVLLVVAGALGVGSRQPLAQGIAVGLLVFAAIGFTVDHFSEARAIRYRQALQGG